MHTDCAERYHRIWEDKACPMGCHKSKAMEVEAAELVSTVPSYRSFGSPSASSGNGRDPAEPSTADAPEPPPAACIGTMCSLVLDGRVGRGFRCCHDIKGGNLKIDPKGCPSQGRKRSTSWIPWAPMDGRPGCIPPASWVFLPGSPWALLGSSRPSCLSSA